MLGWSKQPEGFGIRTTLKLRREQLRQRVLDARRAAGPQIQAAGAAIVAGLRATGAVVSGWARAASVGAQPILGRLSAMGAVVWVKLGTATAPAWRSLRTATGAVWEKLRSTTGWAWQKLCAAAGPVWQKLRSATGSLRSFLARPNVISMLAAAGAMALGAGIGRYRGAGYDSEVVAMLVVGGMLIAPLLFTAWHRSVASRQSPRLAGLSPRVALAAAAVAVLAAGTAWFAHLGPSVSNLGASKEVAGRASAVAGDLLTVAGTTVRLSGIEAPEREQRCGNDSNRWRCAGAAQSALWKVISSRPVRCRLSGSDKAGRPLGYCWMDHVDINAELVRQGYVFAEGGMFARFRAEERRARNAKAGMWIGETQRPAEFRVKAWEEAKRRAPDGCPIKGLVTGRERVYVLPGTPDYDRVRVLASRGDRWFCSEPEAASAGFKAAQRG